MSYHVGQGFFHFLGKAHDGCDTRTRVWVRRVKFETLEQAEVEAKRCNKLYPQTPKWEARQGIEP